MIWFMQIAPLFLNLDGSDKTETKIDEDFDNHNSNNNKNNNENTSKYNSISTELKVKKKCYKYFILFLFIFIFCYCFPLRYLSQIGTVGIITASFTTFRRTKTYDCSIHSEYFFIHLFYALSLKKKKNFCSFFNQKVARIRFLIYKGFQNMPYLYWIVLKISLCKE